MDNVRDPALGEGFADRSPVGEVEFEELPAGGALEEAKSCPLEGRVVVGIKVVDSDDGVARLEESPGDVKADESGCTGDEYGG